VNAVKLRQEPKGRLRFLEQEEADRLLEAAPEPLRSMILLALHTGLRVQSELLTLQWRDVDLRRRIVTVTSQYAKNSRVQPVPLNSLAYEALKRLPKRGPYVFAHRNGSAVSVDPYDVCHGVQHGQAQGCDAARAPSHLCNRTLGTWRRCAGRAGTGTVEQAGDVRTLRPCVVVAESRSD
jgi:integrase